MGSEYLAKLLSKVLHLKALIWQRIPRIIALINKTIRPSLFHRTAMSCLNKSPGL
ncbi:hypothetical protein RchiOBHm_Chr4g0390411 [Rosa chinensis]|uniref:Uncharacterized protein n=1 Tax=Rosa chinensis TaxID=74649 RepID=A0A2P6QQ89_ROSCH|nr:hypothetical protein RchiOBHm_Chr4g0390411 [Rosa chinensis]